MEREATGITGLDEMLMGGFFPETANLVEGAPGTGKTTLGMQFIYHGITASNTTATPPASVGTCTPWRRRTGCG